MTLFEWLRINGYNQRTFCRDKLGGNPPQATFNKYIAGKVRLPAELAWRIYQVTDGDVDLAGWRYLWRDDAKPRKAKTAKQEAA